MLCPGSCSSNCAWSPRSRRGQQGRGRCGLDKGCRRRNATHAVVQAIASERPNIRRAVCTTVVPHNPETSLRGAGRCAVLGRTSSAAAAVATALKHSVSGRNLSWRPLVGSQGITSLGRTSFAEEGGRLLLKEGRGRNLPTLSTFTALLLPLPCHVVGL